MISGDYIAGLTDGEGCFYVNIYTYDKKKYPKARPQTRVHFYIKLREDDIPILDLVRKKLGYGHIYFQKESRKNQRACQRFEVNAREELTKLVRFFERYPLKSPKKQRDLARVKRILEIVFDGDHLSGDGLSEIRFLKSQMHQ